MRFKQVILPLFVLVFLLAAPGTASAAGLHDDQVVFGGTYTLASGETLDGDLVVFGGASTLEPGSLVNGDVVMFGGSIEADGEVSGDLVSLGGSVQLGDEAIIRGDLVAPGGAVSRAAGAQIQGEVITGTSGLFSFPFTRRVVVDRTPWGLRLFTNLLWFLFRTFVFAALAVLVVMFLPTQTERVANSVVKEPVAAGGVGLLTLIVAPLVLLILAITLVLIPVSLLGIAVLGIAIAYGWIALGLEVGKRLADMFHQDWPVPVSSGLGTFLLTLVVTAIGEIACVGWVAPFLVTLLALGGVLLSRFGTQVYAPAGVGLAPAPSTPQLSTTEPPSGEGPQDPE